jgi:hypothetical protein
MHGLYAPLRWATASTLDIEILDHFQSKVLGMIADAPWYVPNTVNRTDLQTPAVKEDIRHFSSQYSARFSMHQNDLIVNLVAQTDNMRLLRQLPNDLHTRSIV